MSEKQNKKLTVQEKRYIVSRIDEICRTKTMTARNSLSRSSFINVHNQTVDIVVVKAIMAGELKIRDSKKVAKTLLNKNTKAQEGYTLGVSWGDLVDTEELKKFNNKRMKDRESYAELSKKVDELIRKVNAEANKIKDNVMLGDSKEALEQLKAFQETIFAKELGV